MHVVAWLESLASKKPTPGGGAVAALNAAVAAAQLEMVINFTTGPKWQDREAKMMEYCDQLLHLREEALELVEKDAEAFSRVSEAYKSKDETAIQKACIEASIPPQEVVKVAENILKIADEIKDSSNPNVISDVGVAAISAKAAVGSAILNIEINAAALSDKAEKDKLLQAAKASEALLDLADSVRDYVRKAINK